MVDALIFSFGLGVTVIVGTALASVIVYKNRLAGLAEAQGRAAQPAPESTRCD